MFYRIIYVLSCQCAHRKFKIRVYTLTFGFGSYGVKTIFLTPQQQKSECKKCTSPIQLHSKQLQNQSKLVKQGLAYSITHTQIGKRYTFWLVIQVKIERVKYKCTMTRDIFVCLVI